MLDGWCLICDEKTVEKALRKQGCEAHRVAGQKTALFTRQLPGY